MNGILLIDKPAGFFSATLARSLQKQFHFQKVGHCGTLDSFATGLLVLCVNGATRLASLYLESDKEYEGKLLLGTQTDTHDITGKIVKLEPVIDLSDEAIYDQIRNLRGEIYQVPPMYSAIKKQGKPLYWYARKNKYIERKSRKIHIYEFEMTKREGLEVTFRVRCSKGTYVRTLCHDLGQKLGILACLKELRRTRSGDFTVEEAILPSLLTQQNIYHEPHWKHHKSPLQRSNIYVKDEPYQWR